MQCVVCLTEKTVIEGLPEKEPQVTSKKLRDSPSKLPCITL